MRKSILMLAVALVIFLFPLKVLPKGITDLTTVLATEKLNEYSTTFDVQKKERVHNINVASDILNNTVIRPNQVFSFNTVLGEATVDKGYKVSKVVVDDKFVDDIGGGICQISSTLFNAIEPCEVTILERHNHTKEVPYVPLGKDATIAYGIKDFKFQNISNNTLIIRSKVENDTLYIAIYST